MSYRTGGQLLVRELNLSSVLRHLQTGAPLSRSQLAGLTGLNKTTVSSLVEELMERSLVHEIGLDATGLGRPATLLEMNPQAGCIVGVELGVDFILAVLADFSGRILWRRRQDVDPAGNQEDTLAQTLKLVDQAVAISPSCAPRQLGLGLATPGTVKVEEGLLIFSPNLQWRDVPLRQIFQQHAGLPVLVDNDANAAALGEHLFGVARQAQNFISLYAGVGIGGGLFLNGELFRGAGGLAGEIGHTNFMMEPYQRPCRCGNRGCWETSANQDAVIERVRSRLTVGRGSLIPRLLVERNSALSVSIILEAADRGDAEAIEALVETGFFMGLGVANLIAIFNPEMVIIGGPLSSAGKYLLPAIKEAVEKTTLPEIGREAQVLLSAFGADASVMGAVALVIEAILSNPTRVGRVPASSGR